MTSSETIILLMFMTLIILDSYKYIIARVLFCIAFLAVTIHIAQTIFTSLDLLQK